MESDLEEKKIQALFSELRTADEQAAPHFGRVWNRAQAAPRRPRIFNPIFVAATALLVFGIVSLAVWSRMASQPKPEVAKVTTPSVNPNPRPAPIAAAIKNPESVVPATAKPGAKRSRTLKYAGHEPALAKADQKLTLDAKAITSWESPTSTLLTSPSDEIFSSLPQLNKSASDLKSFLPSRSN